MTFEIRNGRGYVPAEAGGFADEPIGTIGVDAVFSPVNKVNFHVEDARVGQRTDYDRLVLNGKASYYVSYNNVGVGKTMGTGLVKSIGVP